MSDKLEFALDEAEKEIKRLREVLKKYAKHDCYSKPLSSVLAREVLAPRPGPGEGQ